MDVGLRPVRIFDEERFRAAHDGFLASDQFSFGLNYDPTEPFGAFVERHQAFARGAELPDGRVPETFLVAVVAGDIIGRVSVRHRLNAFLAAEGGHIGYGVMPGFRRRGYATQMLEQSLIIARSLGLDTVLLVCDDANQGSATVIERCGGTL